MIDVAIFYYLAAGAFAGFLAGLFGIGGGMVIVSALIYIFTMQGITENVITHLAVGTSLATIIITSLSSLKAHHAHGAVNWQIWQRMAPGLVLGSLLGAGVAASIQGKALQAIIGVGAFLIGLKMLFVTTAKREENDLSKLPTPAKQTAVGGFIGVVSAIFGIGGGTLTVPFLSKFGLKIQHAVGTSAACGFPIAVAGAVGFMLFGQMADASIKAAMPANTFGFVHVYAFVCVSMASFFVAPFGAKAAHSLPAATLKKAFAVLLLLVGSQLVWDAGVLP